jgi:hypothetical protein
MVQRIKVQSGQIVYEASDVSNDVNIDVKGRFNVTKEINVGTDDDTEGLITSSGALTISPTTGSGLSLLTNNGTIYINSEGGGIELFAGEDSDINIQTDYGLGQISIQSNQRIDIESIDDGGGVVYINGGELYLNQYRWPTADGIAGQALVIFEDGVLGWGDGGGSIDNLLPGPGIEFDYISESEDIEISATGNFNYTNVIRSVADEVSATGTDLETATLLEADINVITSSESETSGVRLPDQQPGMTITIINETSDSIYIYPNDGDPGSRIDYLSYGNPYQLLGGYRITISCVTFSQWFTVTVPFEPEGPLL